MSSERAHDAGRPPIERRVVAEFIGTFFLVAVGGGVERFAPIFPSGVDVIAAALAPGLVVMAMIYAVGDISGAHFNPVVTSCFAVRRSFRVRWVLAYVVGQFAASAAAVALVRALVGHVEPAAGPVLERDHPWTVVGLEALLTCLLVVVVLTTAHEHSLVGTQAALAAGVVIVACRLTGAHAVGASMNPASALGSAILLGRLDTYWLHVVGAVAGGATGVGAMAILHPRTNEDEHEAAEGNDRERVE